VTELDPAIYDIAYSVAGTVAKRYGKYVEKDDVKQECLLWAMTPSRREWTKELLSEPDTKIRQHNESRIAWQMKRAAERYARRIKADKSGYELRDEVYYETFTLSQLLPFIIASVIDGTVLEQAQEMIRDGQPKGSSSPSEGGNLLAMLLDIKRAFLKLEIKEQTLLTYRYHENYTLQQIAGFLECSVSTADRRCSTVLRRLQNELGGESPYQ
jgi:DNA-directed RNA polymerase specialized sigma24 family protein